MQVSEGDSGPVALDLPAEESRVVSVVEKATPAVVSILVSKDVPIYEQYYIDGPGMSPFGSDFFQQFFGGLGAPGINMRIPQQRQKGTEKKEVGGGSGFFISADGYIVTNRHVVDDDTAEYTVFTNDGTKYDAKILAKDPTLDIAILKVSGGPFPFLTFANSDIVKPGQSVIAIGNALNEFRNSVSLGIVSGLSRTITAGDMFGRGEQLEGVIQTDAAINPGNSGGPLLDIKGNVIGVNVAMSSGAENIAFALPARAAQSAAESVQKHGEIVRPYIGVRYVLITPQLKEKNNLTVEYGALVQRGQGKDELAVMPGSPADRAGIVENDIILEIDGQKIDQDHSLAAAIRTKSIGQKSTLKVLSKGTEKQVTVTFEKAPKGQ
jgi:serine protease Do